MPVVARTALLHAFKRNVLFIFRSQVALGHMSCLVEDNGGEQRVTFLYKLAPGPCPKSFGINVARLAQLPDAVSVGEPVPAVVIFNFHCTELHFGHRCGRWLALVG